ncbi:Retrovirus-related Pol polyprotein from transposon 17.6 [Dictyocoela muelleri]|nr:Retrovirus-related Pol polyprotein from transposon 17.6 [Dictyocoela muelleri]
MTDEMKIIVEEIKEDIKERSILKFPNYKEKFILQNDASDNSIGAVLLQKHGIINHFGRKFINSEKNYSIVEKELFAILKSMLNIVDIFQDCFIDVYIDNKNFSFLKTSSNRSEKWRILMNDFNHRINFIEGKNNVSADELSRCFLKIDNTNELKNSFHKKIEKFLKEEIEG